MTSGNQWVTYWPYPNSKVHEANMGPIWGRQDPGGPHVGPMDFAIWVILNVFIMMCNEIHLRVLPGVNELNVLSQGVRSKELTTDVTPVG